MLRTVNNRAIEPSEIHHKMPIECHWAIADSNLLQSIIQRTNIKRGKAGKRLEVLVNVFDRFNLVYLFLFTVGAAQLIKLLFEQRSKSEQTTVVPLGCTESCRPAIYFVGFGAGPEEAMFAAYCAEKSAPVARIDQTKVSSMAHWQQVSLWQAFASLIHSFNDARQAIASLPIEYSPWKNDFLTFVGTRLGYYSYVSAWFSELKASTPELVEVCFTVGDTAAFAAVNADLPTRHLQHGLIRHSLVLPAFDRVDALTHDEVLHFRKRLPSASVHLARSTMPLLTPVKPYCVLVASVYGPHEDLGRVLPFLEYVSKRGLAIYVRPHPREDRSFWHERNLPFSVSLDDSDASFEAAMERLRPSLVVSWFSTTLADALYRGLIPVSVSARDDANIQDLVYPLFRHCLHWPSDQNELEALISSERTYATTLSRLRFGME